MKILVVVSHPDDEVLGCGGTIWDFARKGHDVRTCILSGAVLARTRRPRDADLESDIERSHEILGLRPGALGDFPNLALNTVPHLQLVQFIEQSILDCGAEVLFTHHPNDLNNDHRHTALACLAAARLSHRRDDIPPIRAVYLMEILSSTDWGFSAGHDLFQPTTFYEIGEDGLAAKLKALEAYRGVMRPYPHSRSSESIRALATLRGSQAALRYAEAFQLVYERKMRDTDAILS